MQIANPNIVIQTEPLKERVHWNPKTPLEEILENHNLTWLWSTPMVTRSSMVCSLLLDFHHSFAMTPAFFWAFFFAINLSLLKGVVTVEG